MTNEERIQKLEEKVASIETTQTKQTSLLESINNKLDNNGNNNNVGFTMKDLMSYKLQMTMVDSIVR